MDSFRRKKSNKLADIQKKIKGAADREPTEKELIAILETFAERDEDGSWVSFIALSRLDYSLCRRLKNQ